MKKRIIFDLVLLGVVFYAPWWVITLGVFVGVFLFPFYYEIIIFGIITDLLYGAGSLPLFGTFGILAAVCIFFAASYTKNAVR